MEIGSIAGKTAVDLIKSENVQNKAISALGMLFPYAGLTKKAVDMYISEIEKSDMSIEAKMFSVMNARKTLKKVKNQKQIADIAIESAKEGTDFTEASGVSEEWLERFMDSAGFVSDENIQLIWGKILSNEFENPGTTPPNMIRILSEMTPVYAKAFRKLCSMKVLMVSLSDNDEITGAFWKIVVPYSENNEFMNELGVSFQVINELETLGVIKFDSVAGYITTGINDNKVLLYINGETTEITQHETGNVPIGDVIFTSVGEALKKITMTEEIQGYNEAVKKYMSSRGVVYSEDENYQVGISGDRVRVGKQ